MDDALEVEDLSVRYGDTEVLSGLSFRLPARATLAVIGPNGSGKTVLFRALVGAIPFGGSVRWADGTRFGYVPQKLDLERDLPVSGLDLLRARARLAALPRVEPVRVIGRVGLSQKEASRPIGALSGGQFQMLLFALALIGDPNVLLLDEPTASIDEPGQERLYALMREVQSERPTTVLLISHELSVVAAHATHVLCLGRRRSWFGAPREVITAETLAQMYGTPVRLHVHDDH